MEAPEYKVLGYTFDQWAIVAGRLHIESVGSIDDALQARMEWRRRYMQEPGEIVLADVEPEKNFGAACDVFSLHMPAFR